MKKEKIDNHQEIRVNEIKNDPLLLSVPFFHLKNIP